MSRFSFMLASLSLLTLSLAPSPAAYAALSSATVTALAIYVADVNTSDTLPDALVNYNVTASATIDAVLSGIQFNEILDCSGIEAKSTSYLYVKLADGTRKVYHLFLGDSHLSIRERRDFCFAVDPTAKSLIQSLAQH